VCDIGTLTVWTQPFAVTFARITFPRSLFVSTSIQELILLLCIKVVRAALVAISCHGDVCILTAGQSKRVPTGGKWIGCDVGFPS
jgi:hypothetical protein